MSTSDPNRESESVAVIGIDARLPDAPDLEAFWRNLCEGKEAVRTYSLEELRRAGVPERTLQDPRYVRAGIVLDGYDEFDSEFFGFTDREAAETDPQHRLFLEACHAALEDAGYDPARYEDRIGVFASCSPNTHFLNSITAQTLEDMASLSMASLVPRERDYLATRVSYKLNLRGPSYNVQTGCSSSLAGVHLACQSLLLGECSLALVGGVSVRIPQGTGYLARSGDILSHDGHCRPFDERATGTILGAGCVVLALKRLDLALAERDNIRAVILGCAVNNDGSSKVGFTAPSVESQAEVISEALAIADVSPESIGYIEAHGTGTKLGDPVETLALQTALCNGKLTPLEKTTGSTPWSCPIGSVKANIGHLDAASGCAGLLKAILCVENSWIPPSPNFETLNPEIDFDHGPFDVNTVIRHWNAPVRNAGVSSFGVGGTNVHLILQSPPERRSSSSGRNRKLLVFSAKTRQALEKQARRFSEYLEKNEPPLADVAYTLQQGRGEYGYRHAVVCRDLAEAREKLKVDLEARLVGREAIDGHCKWQFFCGDPHPHDLPRLKALQRNEPAAREWLEQCREELDAQRVRTEFEAQWRGEAAPSRDWDLLWSFLNGAAVVHCLEQWGMRSLSSIATPSGELLAAWISEQIDLGEAMRRAQGQVGNPLAPQEAGAWIRVESPLRANEFGASDDISRDSGQDSDLVFVELGAVPDGWPTFHDLMPARRVKVIRAFRNSVPSNGTDPEDEDLSQLLGELWCRGFSPDWKKYYKGEIRNRVSLPTYPFERRSFPVPQASSARMSPTTTRSPQHGFALDEWESSADTRQGTSLRSNESPSSDSDAIQTIFQDILGLEECPSRASLFSMGGHSVDAIQILSSTRERFGVDVSMEDFLDDPSVDTLTRLVQAASPTPAVGIDRDPEFVVEAEPTLARHDPPQEEHPTDAPKTNRSKLDFSLFFFSGDEQECQVDKYQLVLEAARFADAHGFHAIWTPERHFHRFGGLYPNPAVLGAAIATVTRRIQLRAGSVVLPLHHPIRVAEEWSVVDNLSRGRVGIAFAAGFHPHDFLLHPDHFEQRRSLVLEGIDTFRSLWRGESFDGLDGNGKQVSVRSYPRPVQAEPPIWIAAGTKPESFVAAGRQGLHLLTAPLQLSFEELERYIAMYREARAAAGHTPESGHVTMMLHTYIGEDLEEVRKTVRPAFLQYLQNHSELTRSMVDDWDELGTEDHHALFEFAFERYFNSSSLFGTIESCLETVRRMNAIGVDEIACLLDFGLDLPTTLSGLERIVSLSELYKEEAVNP